MILDNIRSYYSSLYTRRSNKSESDCLSYLTNLNLQKLSVHQQNLCEGKLTRRECWEALLSMGSNKSPSNDGLSKEFYVCFFDELITYLLDALNLAFDQGQLSNSQRQAMITLFEKKGKDKRYLKNWRPISLINADAKIASKALAFSIRKVVTNLIHSDQTAYVKGRYIGESVHLISDILEYTENKGIEAILFSADFEKAFDSIDHTFLFSVLKSYGFSPDFIQWVKTLFNDAESCVMNKGHSTGYFPLKRGTRQGDPLSAYLFILALEVMLFQVRSNEQIEGIKINNFEVTLSAYADDTYFFALDIQSLLAVLNTCKTFQEFSSLKLNLEKCQARGIGAAKDKSDTPINCNWININHHKVVTLGVFNSYNYSLAEKHNFLNQITSVKERLHTWGHRGLTLAVRILIFKSMAQSKTAYTSTMLSPPKQFINLLSSIKQNFIWNGRHP